MMTSEDIDRSFGNSPYFFYNHYPDEEKKEQSAPETKSKVVRKLPDKKPSPLRSKIYQDIPEYPSA